MKLLPNCREVRERLTDYRRGRPDPAGAGRRLAAPAGLHGLRAPSTGGLLALPWLAKTLLGPEGPPPPEAADALQAALRRLGGHRHS